MVWISVHMICIYQLLSAFSLIHLCISAFIYIHLHLSAFIHLFTLNDLILTIGLIFFYFNFLIFLIFFLWYFSHKFWFFLVRLVPPTICDLFKILKPKVIHMWRLKLSLTWCFHWPGPRESSDLLYPPHLGGRGKETNNQVNPSLNIWVTISRFSDISYL